MEGNTALSFCWNNLTSSNGLARWHRKVVALHYIHSHIMYNDISDMHPLTWLKAALFQKPKQRKLRRFPLMFAYATFCRRFANTSQQKPDFLLPSFLMSRWLVDMPFSWVFTWKKAACCLYWSNLLLASIGTSFFASFCAHRHVLAASDGIYFTCISTSSILKAWNTYAGHHFKYIWPHKISWILDINLFCSYS